MLDHQQKTAIWALQKTLCIWKPVTSRRCDCWLLKLIAVYEDISLTLFEKRVSAVGSFVLAPAMSTLPPFLIFFLWSHWGDWPFWSEMLGEGAVAGALPNRNILSRASAHHWYPSNFKKYICKQWAAAKQKFLLMCVFVLWRVLTIR